MCSSCYVARMRPHRGACLPIDTAQLASLAGRSQMRSDLPFGSLATASRDVSLPLIAAQFNLHRLSRALTYGTLATAPRRPPALHVAAPLSPYRLSRAVRILLTRLARDRTAARQPSVLPRSSALEGWSPRAYLATWHACDRIAASTCPSLPRSSALAGSAVRSSYTVTRLCARVVQLCVHLAMWHDCDRIAASTCALIAAQLSPRELGRALILQCGRLVRPPRGVSLPFIVAQLSPRKLGRALILQYGRLVRPPCGVNLPFIVAQLSPRELGRALILHWQACATAPRRQPAFHRRVAQPSRARPCAHLTMWQTTLWLACDRIAVSACPSLPHKT